MNLLLGDLLERSAIYFPDKIAVVCRERTLTYDTVNCRVNMLANALIHSGIKAGDRVAIVCENSAEYLEVVFAAAKMGAVATSLNWRLSSTEIGNLITHSDSKAIFFSTKFQTTFDSLQREVLSGLSVISIGGTLSNAVEYEAYIFGHSESLTALKSDYETPVIQMYTSGTTGQPKGVMLTHKNVIRHAVNTIIELEMGRDLVYLNILPMFHAAIYLAINCVFLGGKNVFHAEFDPRLVFSAIEKEKVTCIGCTPTIVKLLIDYPEMGQFDTGSLDLLVYAAAPMPVPLLKKAIKELKCKFAQVFGMTETSPVTHILIPEDHVVQGPEHLTRRLGSVGRPIISVKSKIVDDNGNPCPPNVVGEIVDSGETVMKGYYKMPEATAETIKDGWLYTGDMGFMDEYGYFYLKDRKKDMIISGGENIYPVEVEMCIFEMEQIADVAVIGVPDETWGESVMALVVLNPGAELTEADVIEHCRKKIASYKKPKIVKFMEMLPKNSMGKTQKNILRQQHARS
jgi:fatty-acyl-CoA synthase